MYILRSSISETSKRRKDESRKASSHRPFAPKLQRIRLSPFRRNPVYHPIRHRALNLRQASSSLSLFLPYLSSSITQHFLLLLIHPSDQYHQNEVDHCPTAACGPHLCLRPPRRGDDQPNGPRVSKGASNIPRQNPRRNRQRLVRSRRQLQRCRCSW